PRSHPPDVPTSAPPRTTPFGRDAYPPTCGKKAPYGRSHTKGKVRSWRHGPAAHSMPVLLGRGGARRRRSPSGVLPPLPPVVDGRGPSPRWTPPTGWRRSSLATTLSDFGRSCGAGNGQRALPP